MEERLATLEFSGEQAMNLHVTEAGNAREPRGGPVKFLYPSGSRPLEGYTIKRGVGRGGFGEVYYAASDGGKEVALKLVRRNLDIELRGVVQCMNLKHPNLLSLYDIKQDAEGDTWVVMEYVGGETLDEVIDRHPQGLPEQDVLQWMQGIAAGVAYLHDHGIVHRDLKPGNIFCDDGMVKLGDYGLSKFISASRRSGQTESVGTVHYMAPEVANGRYGKEIDLYALGVILYEMLTGHVPFEGESVGEVLMKHLTAQPDLSMLAEPYRTVVGGALDKDPARRVHSVQELLEGLPSSPGSGARPFAAFSTAGVRGAEAPSQPAPAIAAVLAPEGEEPIWKAIRENWEDVKQSWDRADLTPAWRSALIVVGIVALVMTVGAWLPVLIVGGLCYGGYRVVRSIVLANSATKTARPIAQPVVRPAVVECPRPQTPPSTGAATGSTAAAPARRRKRPAGYGERIYTALPIKSVREKTTELLGSMLLAAGAATAVSVLVMLIFQQSYATFAALAVVSTVGCWGILIPAKFWEGTIGEPLLRRFVLLIVGLSLGTFAWGVDHALSPRPTYDVAAHLRGPAPIQDIAQRPLRAARNTLFDVTGAPKVEAYLAFFGFLLPVLSWWKLADPTRRHRLSLWTAVLYTGWAFLLSLFWSFPDQGVMTAAAMSVGVQLSSPWVNVRARRRAA